MKFGWRGALGIVISVACLFYVFHNIDWVETREQIRHANYVLLALSAVAATCMFPLRARRWRTILDPVAPNLPFGPLWRATAIGMMANNILPARAGELARAYVLSREVPKVSFSTSLASLAVDRVFDALVVLILLAVALVASKFPSTATILGQSVNHIAIGFALLLAILLVGLYALVFFPGVLIRLFELLARRVSPTIEARGRDALRRFADGLSVLRTPRHFAAVFFWTLLHWLVQPLAFWLGMKAVGIDKGLPWSAPLFLQGIVVVGVSVPSSPGYFGLFEVASIAALALYGVSKASATTFAVAVHIVAFIPITVIGAVYFARLGLTLDELGSAGRPGAPADAEAEAT